MKQIDHILVTANILLTLSNSSFLPWDQKNEIRSPHEVFEFSRDINKSIDKTDRM